jgi:hypothetical protein
MLQVAIFAVAAMAAAPFQAPSDCRALGGEIRPVCMSQTLQCVVPYRDAGKPCIDKLQCKGRCLAVDTPRPGRKDRKIVGRCEADNNPCGCFVEVSKGRISTTSCLD